MQEALGTRPRTRSELIAEALGETVAELRLIDAADLISYIRAGQWANIADLVQSSAELSFEDGALTFACAGDFEVSWGHPPSLSLDLEFQHGGTTAFFALMLGPNDSRIVVKAIWFASAPRDEADGTRTLAFALAAAQRAGASRSGGHR